jgi:hypothetical protein
MPLLLRSCCTELMKTIITLRVFVSLMRLLSHYGRGKQTQCPYLGVREPTPKMNVWCSLMHNKVTGTFFHFWVHHFGSRFSGHDGVLCCTSVRRVSAMGSSPKGWCIATLGVTFSSVLQCKPFQTDGLGGTVQHHGHHVHRTLPLWTF